MVGSKAQTGSSIKNELQSENKLQIIVEDLHVEDANEKDLESDMATLGRLRSNNAKWYSHITLLNY